MIQKPSNSWAWPLFMTFIRLPLILLGNAVIILAFRLSGQSAGMATGAVFATLSVTVANVICLLILLWRARVEGFQLRAMVGFRRSRFLRDLTGGLAWSILLFALLMGGVLATFLIIQSISGGSFEQIILGDADFTFETGQWLAVFMAIIAAGVFPILNASVEELQYRGYAQPRLLAVSGSVSLGIVIQAAGFGLQHMAFAYTLAAALPYIVGFFLWGIGAGIIAHRQQRLAQLIMAHLISNLSFGIVPLFFMLSGK